MEKWAVVTKDGILKPYQMVNEEKLEEWKKEGWTVWTYETAVEAGAAHQLVLLQLMNEGY